MSTSETPLSDAILWLKTQHLFDAPEAKAIVDEILRLRRELAAARAEQISALALVARIREALGDNGKRMQDELVAYCRELAEAKADGERLDWIIREYWARGDFSRFADRADIDAARKASTP